MIYQLNTSDHNKQVYTTIAQWMSKHPDGIFNMVIKVEYSQISDVLINKKVKPALISAQPKPMTFNPFTLMTIEIEKSVQALEFGQLLVTVVLKNGIPQPLTLDITLQKHYKFKIDRPTVNPSYRPQSQPLTRENHQQPITQNNPTNTATR